jgi:Protein of unknown function with PCYCGC motif
VEDEMKISRKLLAAGAIAGLFLALSVLAQFAAPLPHQQAGNSSEPVPAFHAQPPTGELPSTMDPSIYTDKLVHNAYLLGGQVKTVLYQQPCYCHCDRSSGHGSLLDCFVGRHGSGCGTCQKEALYSYEQTRKGKTPEQIREGIMHGDWQKIDLAKYETNYLPSPNAAEK